MRKLVLILFLLGANLPAQKLPQPLKLPPGLVQTLPISKPGSYVADAVKIQDCPEDKDNPLGLCNNVLFGGLAMYVSHLNGTIQIRFYPPVNNVSQFEITHPGGLRGDDAVMRAPEFYQFPVTGTVLTDTEEVIRGEVDLTTGVARNVAYRLLAAGSLVEGYKNLNPKFKSNELPFPGFYGTQILTRELHSSLIRFDQRADGLLDFTFYASSFLPLGNNQGGLGDDKVRIPLPFCSAPGVCRGMEAPGTSLHPRLRISTRAPDDPPCGAACPDIPFNTTQIYTVSGFYASQGDVFNLGIPELGGGLVEGRSHLQGRLVIQFGDRYGDSVPVSVQAVWAEGLLAEPPPSPIPGFGLNMLGFDEFLRFPNYTFQPKEVAFAQDPYDIAVGILNLRTGKFLGDLVVRGLPVQDLLFAVQAINIGRIPQDTFRFQGPASFERGAGGSTIFRYNAEVFLDFDTLFWPDPDYNTARGWQVGKGAVLNPFFKIQASQSGVPPVVFKSGDVNERSSFGDAINLRYAIPCDVANPSFSFVYTNSANASRGGTFTMKTLASVTCTSARGSTTGPGDADIVTFSGFGSWSKDDDLHLATVQISTAPDSRYWAVQIDGGLLSNANNKPAARPVP